MKKQKRYEYKNINVGWGHVLIKAKKDHICCVCEKIINKSNFYFTDDNNNGLVVCINCAENGLLKEVEDMKMEILLEFEKLKNIIKNKEQK